MQRCRDEALRQISSSAPRIRGGALKPEARVVGAASENRRFVANPHEKAASREFPGMLSKHSKKIRNGPV